MVLIENSNCATKLQCMTESRVLVSAIYYQNGCITLPKLNSAIGIETNFIFIFNTLQREEFEED